VTRIDAPRLLSTTRALAVVVAASLAWASLADAPRRAAFLGEAPARPPARIVSLAPVVTETLFALGAGERVVGVTRFCDRPSEAAARKKVGGFVDVQLEAVLALAPDLVVAMPSLGQRQVLDALVARGVPVAAVHGDTLDEIEDLVAFLARATDRVDDGTRLAARIADRVARARGSRMLADRRVLLLVGTGPFVAAGPGTYADEIARTLGARRALDDTAPAWPVLSLESIAARAPDVVLVLEGATAAAVVERELTALPAAKRPRVFSTERPVLMRPGPALVDDLDALEAALVAAEEKAARPTVPAP